MPVVPASARIFPLLFLLLGCPPVTGCNRGPVSPSSSGPVSSRAWPSTPLEAHRTDFLTLAGVATSTLLLPGEPERLDSVLATLQMRGYTDIYLYVVNEGDFGGLVTFNWYEDPQGYREILKRVVQAGIRPVVWLAPDDAPRFHQTSAHQLPNYWRTFIPAIDDLVGSYVLGLEMNEYWTREEQIRLGNALNTSKPVFAHFEAGRDGSIGSFWSRIRAAGLIYQYEDRTPEGIGAETEGVVAKLAEIGRVVVAGEYAEGGSEANARSLGDIAMAHGAIGYGNGGTR